MKNKEAKIAFAMVSAIMILLWLLLSGFNHEELIAGIIASLIVASMSYKLFRWEASYPRRFLWLLAYIPYYLYAELVSHLQVIYMIFTGKTNPGIVEVENPHKSDYGTSALSNSITMTPGTLTLEAQEGCLYIHWLSMKKDRTTITAGFEKFLRRIWP
jgi:multicomponent Na+:H+ antiporter subunit E